MSKFNFLHAHTNFNGYFISVLRASLKTYIKKKEEILYYKSNSYTFWGFKFPSHFTNASSYTYYIISYVLSEFTIPNMILCKLKLIPNTLLYSVHSVIQIWYGLDFLREHENKSNIVDKSSLL